MHGQTHVKCVFYCLWCVCGLIRLGPRLFVVVLICGMFQDLFFNLVVVFNFSIALSLLLPTDLICSQAHILTLGVFLLCVGTASFQIIMCF